MNTNTNTNIDLTTAACLSKLTINSWNGQKSDKQAANEAALSKGAKAQLIKMHKDLISCPELTAVKKHESAARVVHNNYTRPWAGAGLNVLSNANLTECISAVDEYATAYPAIVERFINIYPSAIHHAQRELGELFKATDYPTPEALRAKFRMVHDIFPLADATDFRVNIAEDIRASLAAHYEQRQHERLQEMSQDIYNDLHKHIGHMLEKLDYSDDSNKKIFRNSLLTNLSDLLNTMDRCNIGGDPAMASTARQLRQTIQGITPDNLRNNPVTRERVREELASVLQPSTNPNSGTAPVGGELVREELASALAPATETTTAPVHNGLGW